MPVMDHGEKLKPSYVKARLLLTASQPRWDKLYSDEDLKNWVVDGCTSAKIGCLDCKKPLIDAILKEQQPIRERANEYMSDPETVRGIIADGCEAARDVARETLEEVRDAMGLIYR